MQKDLLEKIRGIIENHESSDEDKKTLLDALDGDDSELQQLSDKVTKLETDLNVYDGIDVAKTKAINEMLKENGLDDASKLLDLVKKGEATEAQKAELNKKIETMQAEQEAKEAQYQKDILQRDSISTLMSQSTFGKELPAKMITNDLLGSDSIRKENGIIQIKDKNGNWFGVDSKEAKEFIETSYADINPKPVTGSNIDHNQRINQQSSTPTWSDATATN